MREEGERERENRRMQGTVCIIPRREMKGQLRAVLRQSPEGGHLTWREHENGLG